jgi:hypothetical protein
MVEPWTRRRRAATQRVKAKGGPSLVRRWWERTSSARVAMLSTADWQRWEALKDAVKMVERVVG